MNDRTIRIAHIVQDDKFIDAVKIQFEADKRFDNEFFLVVDSPNYTFRLIQDTQGIRLLSSDLEIKQIFCREDIDCIYFYSLPNYRLFRFIPDDKIVIWWAWGWDIYGEDRFIDIPLYKQLTKRYLKVSSPISKLKRFFKKIPLVLDIRDGGNRKKIIKRIDYFQPVIHIEFKYMQQFKGFRAHEFYNPGNRRNTLDYLDKEYRAGKRHIIIGHSATYTNNHLDVWNTVEPFIPVGTSVFFPINYGKKDYADYLSNTIKSDFLNIVFIKDFLPKEEYFEILDSCGYAVFGVLREQAIANIYRCLLKGIKLFLYKDSVPFQYLTQLGCIVFSIDDIDDYSFKTPMTYEQVLHNRECLLKESEKVDRIRERAITEIQMRINNNI